MASNPIRNGFLALVLVFATFGLAAANNAGPPVGHSGSPAFSDVTRDRTCAWSVCHTGNTTNNGAGAIRLLGLPAEYTPGETYELTVHLESTSTAQFANRRWGFQLTAMRAETGLGAGAGNFVLPTELRLQLMGSKQRQYVSHNQTSNRMGQESPVAWTLSWVAPAEPQGKILFYYAGNAANGGGSSAGDFIYIGADSVDVSPTPVEGTSWGAIKARETGT